MDECNKPVFKAAKDIRMGDTIYVDLGYGELLPAIVDRALNEHENKMVMIIFYVCGERTVRPSITMYDDDQVQMVTLTETEPPTIRYRP